MKELTAKQGTKDIKNFIITDLSSIEEIIDYIKDNPAIINVGYTKKRITQRVIDILVGAVYAYKINICPLDKENYLIVKK